MLTTDALRLRAQTEPERVVFRLGGLELTYADWLNRSAYLASNLVQHGVQRAQCVAIALGSRDWLYYATYVTACQLLGAIPIAIPEYMSSKSVTAVVRASGATWLIARDNVEAPPGTVRILLSEEPVNVDWQNVLPVSSQDDTSTAEIAVTSGTTGSPKLIACRHGDLMDSAIRGNAARAFGKETAQHLSRPIIGTNAAQRAIANALRGTWYCFNLLPDLEPQTVTAALDLRAFQEITLVPTAAAALVRYQDAHVYHSVNAVRMGSCATPAWVARGLRNVFPNAILRNNYGMTEAGHFRLTGIFDDNGNSKLTYDRSAVQIRDHDGRECGPGDDGILWVRDCGAYRRSYYRPNRTADPISDKCGWIDTNDLVHVVSDHELAILGRRDEIVNVGGIKVSLAEVDQAVSELRSVADCGAFAVGHPTLGSVVGVAFVRNQNSNAQSSLLHDSAEISRKLGASAPRAWLELDEIPRTPTGKVRRQRLVELLGETRGI